jgi:peptide/nickel transport system ATP-binding protein
MTAPLLHVRDLSVTYPGPPPVRAVDALDLAVYEGECLGLLGESGSGKSSLARALLGVAAGATVGGELRLGGIDLCGLDEEGWRDVRWRRIGLSFQSTAALNPVLRIGDQVAEPLEVHLGLHRGAARERALSTLAALGLQPEHAGRYPRELSGGQRRLALLAMAAVCEPELLLLDEPTSGLDAVTRDHVLAYLDDLRGRLGTTLVVLGHDVEALERLADRVGVLYRGWLAEIGSADRVLEDPRHPYVRGLLDARPTLATLKDLRGIRGRPPRPGEDTPGCPFAPRCTQAVEECTVVRPGLVRPSGEEDGRVVACVRGGVLTLLSARGLAKAYRTGGSAFRRRTVTAVDDVDLDVRHGEVVGLVGSTGAGKSTLGLLVVGLLAGDAGSVEFEGRVIRAGDVPQEVRRGLQMVFQDPFEALSPRLTIRETVREPLEIQKLYSRDEAEAVVRAALAEVRLPSDDAFLGRYTHELSGGELQRVSLARALVLEPRLLVLDEPVAMLDPSEQAELLHLLKTIQRDRGLAMVLISHDLASVLRIADRVLVLDEGRVVEEQSGTRLFVSPRHTATRALLAASGRDAVFSPDVPQQQEVSDAP